MLLFGGESSEHDVSVSSASNVVKALDNTKYEIILTYIDRDGKWWMIDIISDYIDTTGCLQLTPILGSGIFHTIPNNKAVKPDVILPILHGANGEDGTVQGLAKLLHIPIVGCGVEASSIAMDKVITKQLLEYSDIKTVPYAVHILGQSSCSFDQLSARLGDMLFIKPARSGSSVGISKVKNSEELISALAKAHKHDSKVLIETAITARELEVAILGNGNNAKPSGVGEIIPDREFYDFDSKYDDSSKTKTNIPADISPEIANRIKEIALQAYDVIGCEGLARIDFFLSDDNVLYLNEINTMPGFTNISMYPKLWHQEGLAYSSLIDALISDALER